MCCGKARTWSQPRAVPKPVQRATPSQQRDPIGVTGAQPAPAPKVPAAAGVEMKLPTMKRCPKCGGLLSRKLRFDQKVQRYISFYVCRVPCAYEGVA